MQLTIPLLDLSEWWAAFSQFWFSLNIPARYLLVFCSYLGLVYPYSLFRTRQGIKKHIKKVDRKVGFRAVENQILAALWFPYGVPIACVIGICSSPILLLQKFMGLDIEDSVDSWKEIFIFPHKSLTDTEYAQNEGYFAYYNEVHQLISVVTVVVWLLSHLAAALSVIGVAYTGTIFVK